MISNEAWLTVGKLVAPHGLRGEIRINPSSDFPERFTRPGKRWVQKINENQPNEISLLSGRQLPGKKVFVVRFAGINSRNEAQLLIGSFLLVPINDRPKLDKNEFHYLAFFVKLLDHYLFQEIEVLQPLLLVLYFLLLALAKLRLELYQFRAFVQRL